MFIGREKSLQFGVRWSFEGIMCLDLSAGDVFEPCRRSLGEGTRIDGRDGKIF